ncbi:MAG TPA: hypothetical protein VGW78_05475 [Candidatus Babeliales bacterium]|nr:hypothetical protein [Candidatus Babeliales bacterium]
MKKIFFTAKLFPLCISLLLSAPVAILSMEHSEKVPLATFEHLNGDSVRRVALSLEDGQDVYALGSTNKNNLNLILRNSNVLNSLIQKGMIPCFKLEDTRISQNLNQEFRTILFSKDNWNTRKNKLKALYKSGFIQLNMCAKTCEANEKNVHNNCIIPLVDACTLGDLEMIDYLLNKGADSSIKPSEICKAPKYNFDTITEIVLKIENGKQLLPRVKAIELARTPIVPNTLHYAITQMLNIPDTLSNDYRGIEHLIKLGAPIDNEINEKGYFKSRTPVQLFVLNKNALQNKSESYKKNMLTLLIASNADINKKNSSDDNALSLSSSEMRPMMQKIRTDYLEFSKVQQANQKQ